MVHKVIAFSGPAGQRQSILLAAPLSLERAIGCVANAQSYWGNTILPGIVEIRIMVDGQSNGVGQVDKTLATFIPLDGGKWQLVEATPEATESIRERKSQKLILQVPA